MNLIDRQRDDFARSVDRTTILPIGQAVVVRFPTSGNRTSTNPPAVVIRYYRSVANPPKGGGNWAGMMRFASLSALPAPFSGRRGTFAGFLQFVRVLPGGLLRAPHHACKQAARCFSKSFEVLRCVFAHDEQHARRTRQSAVKT